jgi:hypothetical protein
MATPRIKPRLLPSELLPEVEPEKPLTDEEVEMTVAPGRTFEAARSLWKDEVSV